MYSQNDEEKYILEAVGDQPGVFLDIGAWDGKTFSNTAALVDRGWSGVLVEPSPSSFNALRERYGDNPRLQLVHAAVGQFCGLVQWWDTGGDGVSTSSEKHFKAWDGTAKFNPPYFIAQITAACLIDSIQENIDVISIDTEGTSIPILEELLRYHVSAKVIVVEYDLQDEALTKFAQTYGFEPVYKSSENLVLVHESISNRVSR